MEDTGFTSLQLAFVFGLIVALAGDFIWAHLLLLQRKHRKDRRRMAFVLYLTGFIASVALTASALGAVNREFGMDFPPELFTFVASVGRGAILMTGIILLVNPQHRPEGQ